MTAMRRLNAAGLLMLAARLIVGLVLISSSIHKISDPVTFLKLVNQYGLVPPDWPVMLNLIAVVVPWLEMVGGIALLAGIGLSGVGAVTFLMLAGFTAAIIMRTPGEMARQGKGFFDIAFSCGCAGSAPEIIWWKLVKNTGLIVLALLITISRSRFLTLSALIAWLRRGSAAPDASAASTKADEDPDLAGLRAR